MNFPCDSPTVPNSRLRPSLPGAPADAANEPVPQRRVRGVTIGRIFAVNDVGQCAPVFKTPKDGQQILHLLLTTGRQQSARAEERIPSPIQKPRIAGYDGLATASSGHVG